MTIRVDRVPAVTFIGKYVGPGDRATASHFPKLYYRGWSAGSMGWETEKTDKTRMVSTFGKLITFRVEL